MKRLLLFFLAAGMTAPLTAESFPSARGAWSPAVNELSASRLHGRATLLLDGRVAVSGGGSAVIDLFDPATNSFSPGPADVKLRSGHTATRLKDGRVLFAGGSFDSSCSIYDPAAGTIVPAAPMLSPRQDHTATLLADGRVLVIGGNAVPSWAARPNRSCEIYDPATGTWSAAGRMFYPRAEHTAMVLPDGRVGVYGGYAGGLSVAETYDIHTMQFTKDHWGMWELRYASAVLPGDQVFTLYQGVATTQQFPTESYRTRVLFDGPLEPATGVLADGRFMMAGTRTLLCVNNPNLECTTAASPIVRRSWPEGVALQDGRFLVVGGHDTRIAEIFDPAARGVPRGDFDGDGRSDVLWHHPATGRSLLWRMNGVTASGSYIPRAPSEPGYAWRLEAIADLEGGGVTDAIWRDTANAGNVLRFAYGPDINDQIPPFMRGQGLEWSVIARDFNADGRAELLWRRGSGEVLIWNFSIGATHLPYTDLSTSVPDPDFVIAAADDFDGDGNADVLWRHRVRGENYIWFMEPAGDYRLDIARAGQTMPVTDMNYAVAGTGDFDGDGKADIVWRSVSGPTRIWFMNGVTIVNDVAVPAPGAGWNAGVIGDFDGDGKSDIFWRNPATGENAVSLFDGGNVKTSSSLPPVTDAGWILMNP